VSEPAVFYNCNFAVEQALMHELAVCILQL
jgi:hypothetical protein